MMITAAACTRMACGCHPSAKPQTTGTKLHPARVATLIPRTLPTAWCSSGRRCRRRAQTAETSAPCPATA